MPLNSYSTFKVTRQHKGEEVGEEINIYYHARENVHDGITASEVFNTVFPEGEEMIVFAYKNDAEGYYETNFCTQYGVDKGTETSDSHLSVALKEWEAGDRRVKRWIPIENPAPKNWSVEGDPFKRWALMKKWKEENGRWEWVDLEDEGKKQQH